MQLFINYWSTSLTVAATAEAVSLSVPPVEAAKLVGLGSGDHYLLTLFEVDGLTGEELRREIVRATAVSGGSITVVRDQEGSGAQVWDAGQLIEARLTKETMETLRDAAGGGAPLSNDDPAALGSVNPGESSEASRSDHVHPLPTPAEIGAATAAQGALADTAVQPGDLAPVATSGDYADLTDKPTLGTAAATAATDYATAAQGATADSAVQPGDLAPVATSGAYADLTGKPTIPSTAAEVGAIAATEKGAASGVATLGSDSKIPLAQLPATAITSTYVVANEAAMLALAAQEGDVAIRPDINTSFILAAEPAGTLSNWQEILAPSAGGGAPVGSSTPQPLGTATPGVSSSASRQDHVHDMPSAADIGLGNVNNTSDANKPVSTAQQAALDDKVDVVAGKGLSTEDYSTAEKAKLGGIATGATANDTDANLKNRANHTGSQATSTVTGLDSALAARALIAGLPSRDVTASGAVTPSDAGKWLICNSASPITLTIGAEATAAWTTPGILPMFHILQIGAGAVTVTGDGFSVTLHAADTNVLDGAGAAATALWRASNTWSLIGRLVAV